MKVNKKGKQRQVNKLFSLAFVISPNKRTVEL